MVTSRDNEIDELLSLNYGADQYVTKAIQYPNTTCQNSRTIKKKPKLWKQSR